MSPDTGKPIPTLDQLVAGITDDNRHGEFYTGPDVGNEVWASQTEAALSMPCGLVTGEVIGVRMEGCSDMSQTITVSDELYKRLKAFAQQKGLNNIEQLLEEWGTAQEESLQRMEAVQKIDELRERLFGIYGEMPDSAALIREDRDR